METCISDQVLELCDKYLGEYKVVNGEVKVHDCPFCHGGDHGDTDTFYIGVNNGAYKCHRGSCGASGSFKQLAKHFGEDVGGKVIPFPTTRTKKTYQKPDPTNLYPLTDEIVNYCQQRGISEQTLKDFNISADQNGNMLFPFFRDKELVFVKYRKPKKFVKSAENKSKEWMEANTEPILFNMDNVSFNTPLYITEGQMDAMALYEAGIKNVVSVPMGCNNLDWVNNCWDWLEKFKQFVLFGDSDACGLEMMNTLMRRLGEDRCMIPPDYPECIVDGKDIGRICKDANEILFSYGKEMLYKFACQCEPVPIKGVINLGNVQPVDQMQIQRILTGIPDLDFYVGGLVEGGLTVLSGKRGDGGLSPSLNTVNWQMPGVYIIG